MRRSGAAFSEPALMKSEDGGKRKTNKSRNSYDSAKMQSRDVSCPAERVRMDGGGGERCNVTTRVVPPHCIRVPDFHLRKDRIEMIEAFTEFHLNNLNLLLQSRHYCTFPPPLTRCTHWIFKYLEYLS